MVYTPESQTSDVTIAANGTVVQTVTVDRTQHTFSYRFNSVGTATIVFRTGFVIKTKRITVTTLDINAHAETDSLVLPQLRIPLH